MKLKTIVIFFILALYAILDYVGIRGGGQLQKGTVRILEPGIKIFPKIIVAVKNVGRIAVKRGGRVVGNCYRLLGSNAVIISHSIVQGDNIPDPGR